MEREIVGTCAGAEGQRRSVAQLDVSGMIAAEFNPTTPTPTTHTCAPRSRFPTRVLAVRDGARRTLDDAPLHYWTVAASRCTR